MTEASLAPARRRRGVRRRPTPRGLLAASVVVAAALLTPLAFLVLEASGAGAGRVARLIWRPLT
ncbi:MAG: iron ABC transporter permease, partial [Acidimicrobiales bacterium]